MAITWTDELRASVITAYTDKNPTAETSGDIVKDLSEEFGASVNGIRMILIKAEVYVAVSKASGAEASKETKPKKKTKQESIDELKAILQTNEVDVDDAIVDKMTGKAADYFVLAISKLIGEDED